MNPWGLWFVCSVPNSPVLYLDKVVLASHGHEQGEKSGILYDSCTPVLRYSCMGLARAEKDEKNRRIIKYSNEMVGAGPLGIWMSLGDALANAVVSTVLSRIVLSCTIHLTFASTSTRQRKCRTFKRIQHQFCRLSHVSEFFLEASGANRDLIACLLFDAACSTNSRPLSGYPLHLVPPSHALPPPKQGSPPVVVTLPLTSSPPLFLPSKQIFTFSFTSPIPSPISNFQHPTSSRSTESPLVVHCFVVSARRVTHRTIEAW